jgi:hypothetical protein
MRDPGGDLYFPSLNKISKSMAWSTVMQIYSNTDIELMAFGWRVCKIQVKELQRFGFKIKGYTCPTCNDTGSVYGEAIPSTMNLLRGLAGDAADAVRTVVNSTKEMFGK